MRQRKIGRKKAKQQVVWTTEIVPLQKLDDKPVEPHQNAVNGWLKAMPHRCYVCDDYEWRAGEGSPPPAFLFLQPYPNPMETFVAGLCWACCTHADRDARLDAAIKRDLAGREAAWPVEGPKSVQ
jgi:hypothetical protein